MPGLDPGASTPFLAAKDVDGRDIGERKRRRPSDGCARPWRQPLTGHVVQCFDRRRSVTWPPSGLRPGRIVEETLAEYLVAAPLLQRDLVDPPYFPGFIGELENPVNGGIVAFDHRGHRLGIDMRHARQNAALVSHQQIAADARRRRVLLHAGIFGVIALDSAGMIASLNNGDKLIKTRSRRHETSNASGNHCSIKRFQAKWRSVSRQETRQIKKLEPHFDSIETE